MPEEQRLFEQFPKITLEQWIEKVQKDLKGKPLDELYWQMEETVNLAPFYHPTDSKQDFKGTPTNRTTNNWEIGAIIKVDSVKKANEEALEGLRGGVEALYFRIVKPINIGLLQELLENIETDYISSHFEVKSGQELPLLDALIQLLESRNKDIADFKGSFCIDPFTPNQGLEPLFALLKQYATKMKAFKFIQVSHSEKKEPAAMSNALAELLAKASELLVQAESLGLAKSTLLKQMKWSISIGTSYFPEIAKLRALPILWANLLKAFDEPLIFPELEVHFAPATLHDDPNQNMIQASTQAMAAAIGGAHRIFIPPAAQQENERFYNRIARNIQHILKMESFLDRVVDPAAGSYYIETLTQKLAEAAWAKFQQIEASGGYLNYKSE